VLRLRFPAGPNTDVSHQLHPLLSCRTRTLPSCPSWPLPPPPVRGGSRRLLNLHKGAPEGILQAKKSPSI
jgi:hypothetical protein